MMKMSLVMAEKVATAGKPGIRPLLNTQLTKAKMGEQVDTVYRNKRCDYRDAMVVQASSMLDGDSRPCIRGRS